VFLLILSISDPDKFTLLSERKYNKETYYERGKVIMAKVTRVYTGSDGESHFEDMEIPLEEKVGNARQSKPVEVTEIYFRESKGKDDYGWHNAPRRQFVIMLEGALEIEMGDGTKRRLGSGDVLLAEDTTGRGHLSRSVNRKAIVVPLD
jgi:quercetin dioxygenase-like cupin family protein